MSGYVHNTGNNETIPEDRKNAPICERAAALSTADILNMIV
jgi:hypothetical protein